MWAALISCAGVIEGLLALKSASQTWLEQACVVRGEERACG